MREMKTIFCMLLFLIIPLVAFGMPTVSKVHSKQIDIAKLNKLLVRAQKGDVESETYLGLLYMRGSIGFFPNYEEAVFWLQKSADKDPLARANLAVLYWEGCGTPQSTKVARDDAEIAFHGLQGEFKQLSEKLCWTTDNRRLSEVEYTLGLFYFWGVTDLVAQDLPKAFDLFKSSAELGNIYAIRKVAMMYRYGIGVKQDAAQAFLWTKLLADLNLTFAEYIVGIDYWNGFGVPKNNSPALDWIQKAAHSGYYPAIKWLVERKETIFGISKSDVNRLSNIVSPSGGEEIILY